MNRIHVNSVCMRRTAKVKLYVDYDFSLSDSTFLRSEGMFVWVDVFKWLNLSG